jgi:hypothetical protein
MLWFAIDSVLAFRALPLEFELAFGPHGRLRAL